MAGHEYQNSRWDASAESGMWTHGRSKGPYTYEGRSISDEKTDRMLSFTDSMGGIAERDRVRIPMGDSEI